MCLGAGKVGCLQGWAPAVPLQGSRVLSRRGSGPVLTLDVPCSPDGIVEADFIPAKQPLPFEILPLW